MNRDRVYQIIGNPKYSAIIDEMELYGEGDKFTVETYEFTNCIFQSFYNENTLIGYILKNVFKNDIEILRPIGENKIFIGEYCIDDTFEDCEDIINEYTARTSWFGVIEYYGRISNFNYTCFYGMLEIEKEKEKLTIDDVKRELIVGLNLQTKPAL